MTSAGIRYLYLRSHSIAGRPPARRPEPFLDRVEHIASRAFSLIFRIATRTADDDLHFLRFVARELNSTQIYRSFEEVAVYSRINDILYPT